MIVCADEGDIPAIGRLLVEMHQSSGLDMPPLSPGKIEATLEDVLATGIIFLGMRNGEVAGVLALKEASHWFSEGRFFGDVVFYVGLKHRQSALGPQLLRRASRYAKMRGLPLLMAVVNGVDVDRKDKLYKRLGFRHIGGVYSRGI
jgi:L-amino acid N-acyltransferase YncA